MAGGGQFTSADGPGGKASRFLDAVVAFVVAIFHPIFRVFASAANSPSTPSSHQPQQQQQQPDENNHAATAVTNTTTTSTNNDTKRTNLSGSEATHSGAETMHSQQQSRLAQPRGPKEVNANAQSAAAVHVTLPQIGPPNGALKQENIATSNGVIPVTTDSRKLSDATNSAKYRTVGEEQAEENRQEQLTLPPPIQSLEEEQDAQEPEDPAIAAERAIHHGFMNQALDMVSHLLLSSTFIFSQFATYPINTYCVCG